ncbi:MAG: hypothetical protein PHI12_12240 [Dehalococcoidales bacterium]|nr:hypothetical protein [Dehalococcoidales bacterium]
MYQESIIGNLEQYQELSGNVRYSNSHVPIRRLVTPHNPQVKLVADILHQAPDFIEACQEFVNTFTQFAHEEGDYWSLPIETLRNRAGDCDCLSILLCSILRNYIPPEKVYCAVGVRINSMGAREGHMFVVVDENGHDRILEATASPWVPVTGKYNVYAIFNDQYVFATEAGLDMFDLRPVSLVPAEEDRLWQRRGANFLEDYVL